MCYMVEAPLVSTFSLGQWLVVLSLSYLRTGSLCKIKFTLTSFVFPSLYHFPQNIDLSE